MTILVTDGKGMLATEIKKKSKGMDNFFAVLMEWISQIFNQSKHISKTL